jgi:hypothetical protein
VRSGALTRIEAKSPPGDGSLLDLLLPGPVTNTGPPAVHYDTLSAGDVWLLAAACLFDNDAAVLTAIQRLASLDPKLAEDGLPLMLLSAASGAAA